jgi:hypothetical protein
MVMALRKDLVAMALRKDLILSLSKDAQRLSNAAAN